MRLLFITATRIGDAILSTGLLNALIESRPGLRVTVACGRAAAPLFEAAPGLERLIVIDKMVASLHWADVWARTAFTRWDVLVDLRGAPLTYLIPARTAYRLTRSKGGGHGDEHRVRRMARVLGRTDDPPAPHLWTRAEDDARARTLIPDGAPVLAVGPAANWIGKTWPAERFAALAERLTAPTGPLAGARVAVFGRDDERPGVLAFLESIPPERRLDLMGSLDLLTVFACLKRASMFVGNDSGLMHLAACAGVPTLGLFGPSKESLYAPWGPLCATVRADEGYDDIFPENFDHRTTGTLMGGLSVDRAEAAARAVWSRAREAAA
jgi:heptosyltransferase-3